ncbi:MAG TPA: alpha-amylase family glycosyl hydrolase [Actinomycetota bacterium]|nr:alpha-amylase family glycosyl hydrolase [Actinomycetota bacterium]
MTEEGPRPDAGPWWREAVVYQIYPRSFADGNGDGVGDLEGIRSRLGYLSWLGVDALWLSPFYPSPMKDFGYDVADYCNVDPVFGDLEAFDRMVEEAHSLGIRILVDLVPNHTSDQHPWFVESRSSRDSPKRHWYIWRDGTPDKPPNNWRSAFTGESAWTWDEATSQWYLHLFLPEQPDLNWAEPEVEEAMHGVMRFWLDRGVDGFRIDVVHAIGKDPALPDSPPELILQPRASVHDDPATHPLLRRIRALADSYDHKPVLVGEVHLLDTAKIGEYYGQDDELHLAFNFPALYAPWDAEAWKEQLRRADEIFGPVNAWPTWVLSNHDDPRHRSRYGGSEAAARAAAVLLLTLRGTPFMYQGEELGLENAVIPPDRKVDPGNRDGCRAPIPWDRSPNHGWGPDPWLPWPPEPETRNVEAEKADDSSILHLYRRLLQLRRSSPALRLGDMKLLDSAPGTLAYERALADERFVVVVNFSNESVEVSRGGLGLHDAAVMPLLGSALEASNAGQRIEIRAKAATVLKVG